MTGVVSRLLQDELTEELRRQGIVVWLDKDATYDAFVDDLVAQHAAGEFPYPVVAFRGSFLETVFALEPFGNHYDRHGLLIHMPGFTEETIRGTPILELYEAGARFRRALDTLVRQAATGRVEPAKVDAFLTEKHTLAEADAWLAQAVGQQSIGLEVLLDSAGRSMVVDALVRRDDTLSAQVSTKSDARMFRAYLHKLTGMDDTWFSFAAANDRASPLENVLSALSAWALSVEYVHDLRRPPHLPALLPLKTLSPALVKVCREIVTEVRKRDGDQYERLATEAEELLDGELDGMTPEGRRSATRANTTFLCDQPEAVLQAVALIELAREGWVEPVSEQRRCWPVLVHQAPRAHTSVRSDQPRALLGSAPPRSRLLGHRARRVRRRRQLPAPCGR